MDVKHVIRLANLPVGSRDESRLQDQFTQTLKVVDTVSEVNTADVSPTSQVTGLINVMRQDVVDPSRMLSQQEALSQAPDTQDGYFKVPAIFEK